MATKIAGLNYYLPRCKLTTDDLARQHPDWGVEKIDSRTGIRQRHIAAPDEYASDLAITAAGGIFDGPDFDPGDIDYILFCTQSADYAIPTSACAIQERLGIPRHAGAIDINMGSSGYVYGLGLAHGLIESGQAGTILLLTGDTFSRYLDPGDRATSTIFSDGGTATILCPSQNGCSIGPFVYGTDGRGQANLIHEGTGAKGIGNNTTAALSMNGAEIFTFTLDVAPLIVARLLEKGGMNLEDIDLFVFHQANGQMLEHLRKKIGIANDRFWNNLDHGNTTSSSIPIALRDAAREGALKNGMNVLLAGFGPGYSWAGTILRW